MTLSARNKALSERVLGFSGPRTYSSAEVDTLLDAARAEGSASPPPPAEGVGKEEHGSSCADLSCAQTHKPEPSPAGKSLGERLCDAFQAARPPSGWCEPLVWDDFDESGQASYERAAVAFLAQALAPVGKLVEALTSLLSAARDLPRLTPAPGGAGTVHTFQIEAAHVWANDLAIRKADAILAAAEAASPVLLEGDDQPPETTR